MPNHVTTVCRVVGLAEDVARFRAKHIVPRPDGALRFDFETIVPLPKCIEGTQSGSQADAGFFALTGMQQIHFAEFFNHVPWDHYTSRGFQVGRLTTPAHFAEWLKEHDPETLELGRRALAAFRETGHQSWYEWNCANWGTKWNSYDYEERSAEPGRFVFKFETAWSVPQPIFLKLVELYPMLSFELDSVDEGGPEYAGHFNAEGSRLERVPESRERRILCYGKEWVEEYEHEMAGDAS